MKERNKGRRKERKEEGKKEKKRERKKGRKKERKKERKSKIIITRKDRKKESIENTFSSLFLKYRCITWLEGRFIKISTKKQ